MTLTNRLANGDHAIARAMLDERRNGNGAEWRPTVSTLGALLDDPVVTAQERYIVAPLAAEGEVLLLAAPPKTGKSHFVSQIAADLTTGRDAIDGSMQSAGDVLWIGVDEPARRLAPRLAALGADHTRMHIVLREQGHVLRAAHLGVLLDQVRPVLLVLDTTSQLALDCGVDANDGKEVGVFLRPLVDVIREFNAAQIRAGARGCAGLFIHHAPHHAARAAGSLQWGAIVDAELVLRRKRRRIDPNENESDDDENDATAGDDGTRILEGVTRSGGPIRLRFGFESGRYIPAGLPAPLIERVRMLLMNGPVGPNLSSANKMRARLSCQNLALSAVLADLVQRGEAQFVGKERSPLGHYIATPAMTLYVDTAGRSGERLREEVEESTSSRVQGHTRATGKKLATQGNAIGASTSGRSSLGGSALALAFTDRSSEEVAR